MMTQEWFSKIVKFMNNRGGIVVLGCGNWWCREKMLYFIKIVYSSLGQGTDLLDYDEQRIWWPLKYVILETGGMGC